MRDIFTAAAVGMIRGYVALAGAVPRHIGEFVMAAYHRRVKIALDLPSLAD